MILSECQKDALNRLLEFDNSKDSLFLLSGSAGTGKTTLLGEYIKASKKQIILSAPTHKAKRVLSSKSLGTEASTIHSLLGLKVQVKFGKTSLKQVAKSGTGNLLSVVVVDEASMLDKELMSYIFNDIKKNNNKYVFVGDHCQLPPINEEICPIFDLPEIKRKVFLKQIIRQAAGNPIIKAATALRDMIESGKVEDFEFEENDIGSIRVLDKSELIGLSKMLYLSDEYEKDIDYVKIIAWTNEAVHKYNNFINKIYKVPDGEDFKIGTRILFNEACVKGDLILVNNNAEGTVVNITKSCYNSQIFFDRLEIEFDNPNECSTSKNIFDVVNHHSRVDYNNLLNEYKNIAIHTKAWGKFYALKEKFADIRPNFAITCQKSQGSTYSNVIIDLNDIMRIKDKTKMLQHLYVAVSRASKNVFIIQ